MSDKHTSPLEIAARWYLYELIDPRDGCVFYVGKGSGDRLMRHEKDAAKECKGQKAKRIRDIWAAGLQVERCRVAFFWDEQAAYDAETDRIEEIGLEHLTNVLPGGQKAWERRKAARRAQIAMRAKSPLEMVLSMPGRIAYWLIHTNGGKEPAWMMFSGGRYEEVRNSVSQVAWLHFVPAILQKATETEAGKKKVADAVRPYGIDLRFA